MKVGSLKELYDYIKGGNVFEDLENNCERCKNEVYQDEDFDSFIRKINAVKTSCRLEDKIVLMDNEMTVEVGYIKRQNRFCKNAPDEIIYNFDTIKITGIGRGRSNTLLYNAITILEEQTYSKEFHDELLEELGMSEDEYKAIMRPEV